LKRRNAALPACALVVLTGTAGGAADLPVNGIAIGTSVRALALTLGPPTAVTSGDTGNGFSFSGGATAYADDDGIVLAVQAQTGSPRIDIDGTARAFPIGNYSAAQADADLANVAEFATSTLRSYRLAPRRDLVRGFAAASNRLERVTYGEPGQLARMGLLPGDAAAKAVLYRAPRPRRTVGWAATTGPRTTVYRVAIDRAGSVSGVEIVVASDTPVADAEVARQLLTDRYASATLDGRPVAATIFVELHH
jgi:hypothetical protein